MFPITDGLQQGNVSSQLLYNLAVEYTGTPGWLQIKCYTPVSDLCCC